MTNVDELFERLVDIGQYPKQKTDTVTILEKIGHFWMKQMMKFITNTNKISLKEITKVIEEELNIQEILIQSIKHWDGGYVMCGLLAETLFNIRDPNV